MKINEINNINYFPKIIRRKYKTKDAYPLFAKFSRPYSNAIKARNFSFRGKMSEAELQEKCDELKRQLVEDGVIKDESEISWYTEGCVNEGNIQIARKVFSAEHLKNHRKDILKTTNEENLPVANYICNNPFPLDEAFRILLWTNKQNAQASLLMCMSDDFKKHTVSELLGYITKYTKRAVLKIIEDENFPKDAKPLVISNLTAVSAPFVEKLLDNKDYPRKGILAVANSIFSQEDAAAKNYFYDLFSAQPDCKMISVDIALSRVRAESFEYLKEFYKYFKQQNTLSPKRILEAIFQIQNERDAESKIKIYKLIKAQETLNIDELGEVVAQECDVGKIEKILEYLKQHPDFPQELKVMFLKYFKDEIAKHKIYEDDSFYQGAKKFAYSYKMMMANPKLYVNGEYDSKEEAQDSIKNYVELSLIHLINLANIFDKSTMDLILRKRLEGIDLIIESFSDLNKSYQALLGQLVNCKKPNGEEFSPKEKLSFIGILFAYQTCGADPKEIEIKDNRVDINELEENLLRYVFKLCGMNDDDIDKIPKEKLALWDINSIHFLALQQKQMEEEQDIALSNIIKLVNSDVDFRSYITNKNNIYSEISSFTKRKFETYKLNYDLWLNPLKSTQMQFKYVDSNEESLAQTISQIEEDIEALRKTLAKTYIDKHFSDCIAEGKFKIAPKYAKNKQSLEAFVKNMFALLDRNIFSRAQKNLANPSKRQDAQNTLTIKSHLEQRIKDVQQSDIKKRKKPIDLTIKMWDRNPIKDLFQGNYSTCCIGLGNFNGSASPHYLLNTMFNMIEFVDNNTGQTIGNALCYFIINEFYEPVLVVDNIEIANKNKMSDAAGIRLRDEIASYCKNFLKTISNRNIPIVLGKSYNDVPDQDLDTVEYKSAKILGETDCKEIYVDAFGGWSNGEFNTQDNQNNKEETMKLFLLSESYA